MNKSTKTILITAGICITAGLVISAIAIRLNGKNPAKAATYKQMTANITEDFSNLNVTEISNSITILPSSDGNVNIEYWDSDEYEHDIRVEGDTLVIEYKDRGSLYEHINIDIPWLNKGGFEEHDTIIYLPEGEYGNLDIEGVSSDISISDGYSFGNVSINTVSGAINTGDSSLNGSVEINSTSGSVSIANASESVDINTVSGNVTLNDSSLSSSLKVNTTSGKVTLNNVSASFTSVNTISGNMNFTDFASDDTDVGTTSGSLNATVIGSYHISTGTVSGNMNINCDNMLDGAEFSFSSTSGDLTITQA